MQSALSSTAERVESVANDLKKEFGEQHVWVPTAELLGPYSFIQVLFIKIVKIVSATLLIAYALLSPFCAITGDCL